MLIITSKLSWRRQPTTPVGIQWGHPLANGLAAWMLPQNNVLVNLAKDAIGTDCDEVSRSGYTIDCDYTGIINNRSTNTGAINLTSANFIDGQANVTLINWLNRRSASGTANGGWVFGTGSSLRAQFGITTADVVTFRIGNANAGSVGYTNESTTSMFAGVFDGSATGNSERCKIYKNGLLQSLTFAGTIPTAFPTALTNCILGSQFAATAQNGTGFVGNSLIYLRSLTAEEINSLYENPYQMLAPTYSRRYFIPLVGGGPQTIALTTGNETGVGYSLGTVQPRTIGLTAGNETGLGYALSIVQPRSIAFTDGQETGIGYQLGLVQPRTIALVDGQETGIGYTLGMIQPRVIGLTTGTETGIGYAMGVSAGAGRTIDVTTGSETGLGYSFGVIQPRTIGFAAGAETGIGYALTIVPPGPVLSVNSGIETGTGSTLGVIQHGRKYRYPRPTKAIHTRHYTGRL